MTDWTQDTPIISRLYCPGCEPEADPIKDILDIFWCETHMPSREGALDRVVTPAGYISGSGECGGDDNRKVCDFIHRGKLDE